MSFSLLHKNVTYLIAGIGLFALTLGQDLGMPTALAITGGAVASYFVDGPIIRHRAWASSWTVAVVALLVLEGTRALTQGPQLIQAIEFAAFLQISRLFNRRGAADYQQIAVLAFLHLIAATVLSTEITYGLVFMGFVIVTPWMLALSHLRREIEGNYPVSGPDDARGREAIRRVLASKRVVGGRFLLGTMALSLPLFAMTVAIFLTLPRVGQGFLTFNASRGRSVAGFSNQVELGHFGVIRDDPTVILRVQPEPGEGELARDEVLRLRGTSFDHYDGRRWTRSPSLARRLSRDRFGYFTLQRPPRESDQRLRITLDHLDEPVVFLPTGTVALDMDPRIVRAERVERRLSHGEGLDVRYLDADGVGLIYTAIVQPGARYKGLRTVFEEDLSPYLQMPEGHERVAALAERVTVGKRGAYAQATAVQDYLRELTYTLEQPLVKPDQRPLDVFLFEARRGHCEYFSSAMAVMLRSLGVPARNVTGFVGGRYNPYGEYFALRQGDAHSWVEAYVPDRGWMIFDPTPPGRARLGPRENLWADVSAFVDAVRLRWVTSVLGYDVTMQMAMMRKVTRFIAGSGRGRSDKGPQYPRPWRDARVAARRVGIGIAGVVLLVALIGLVRRLRARRGRGAAVSAEAAQAIAVYRALERALRRRGQPRPPSRTPMEHVAHLQSQDFAGVEAVEEVTLEYMAVRYGGRSLSGDDLSRLRGAVRRVGRGA